MTFAFCLHDEVTLGLIGATIPMGVHLGGYSERERRLIHQSTRSRPEPAGAEAQKKKNPNGAAGTQPEPAETRDTPGRGTQRQLRRVI